MAYFGLKLGLDLEIRAAHPHQKFQGVPPPRGGQLQALQTDYFNKDTINEKTNVEKEMQQCHLCIFSKNIYRRTSQMPRSIVPLWVKLNVKCQSSILNENTKNISRRRSCSPKYPELCNFTLSLCRGRLRNVPRIITHKHSPCSRSRCRYHRSLLKLPTIICDMKTFAVDLPSS